MLSWQIDQSEPIISPERVLAYYCRLLGCELEALSLPRILVGTFQQAAMEHMAERIGVPAPARWPTPIFWPLARGVYRDQPLAVARLPIGAPAAASALELMIAAGARIVILVGSAGSLQPTLPVGSLIIAERALRHEGTSHHYMPPNESVHASPKLVDGLLSAAQRIGFDAPTIGSTWTTDAPYRECIETVSKHRTSGILAVEMEAAALYSVALHRGADAVLVAAISDLLHDRWEPGFHTLAYRRALVRASDLALEAASQLGTDS